MTAERRYLHNIATPTPYTMVRDGDHWHREPSGATSGLYGKAHH